MKKYLLIFIIVFSANTQAQNKNQIFANCQQDKEKFCSAVSNKNIRILQCLLENESNLSASCKTTLKSSLKKAGKKGSSSCKQDARKHCFWTIPGGGRIIKCLLKNEQKLSAECRKKLNDF